MLMKALSQKYFNSTNSKLDLILSVVKNMQGATTTSRLWPNGIVFYDFSPEFNGKFLVLSKKIFFMITTTF